MPKWKSWKSLRPAYLEEFVAKLGFVPEFDPPDPVRNDRAVRVPRKSVLEAATADRTRRDRPNRQKRTALAPRRRRVTANDGQKREHPKMYHDLKKVQKRRTPWLKEFP